MSDEEDFLEDDWDVLYDDGFGAQADDLAEHSLPSPPYLDYDSDGDNLNDSDLEIEGALLEYLDFYYDDDPSLMNAHNSIDQSPLSTRKRRGVELSTVKKKQKPDFTKDPGHDLGSNPAENGRGIVWRAKHRARSPPYQPGKGEKVALLKNWRKLSLPPSYGNDEYSKLSVPTMEAVERKMDTHTLEESSEPSGVRYPANGSLPRLVVSSSASSPLKHSLSSTNLQSATMNDPRKRSKASSPTEGTPSPLISPPTRKRKMHTDIVSNNESGISKRRAMSSGKEVEPGSRSSNTRTRTRKATTGD